MAGLTDWIVISPGQLMLGWRAATDDPGRRSRPYEVLRVCRDGNIMVRNPEWTMREEERRKICAS